MSRLYSMLRKAAFIMIWTALFTTSGLAQPAPDAARPVVKRFLTVAEAVGLALKESPVLRSARQEVAVQTARLGMAKAMKRPSLSANTFLSAGTMPGIIASSPPVMPSASILPPRGPGADQNLMLMIPLWTGGRLESQIRSAGAERSASQSDLAGMEREVAMRVKEAYFRALYARAMVQVGEQWVSQAEESLRVTREMFSVGKVPQYFVLRSETEVANAAQELTTARNNVGLALIDLKTALGVNTASEIDLSETMAALEPDPDVKPLLEEAARSRPELAAAQAKVEAAEARAGLARSAYRPQIYLSGMADAASSREMGEMGGYTAALVLSLPLLDGGSRKAAVEEARAMREKALADAEQSGLQVSKEVIQAHLSLTTAAQNLKTSQAALVQAEEEYRIARMRYEAGRGINVEVMDALTDLVRARTNQVNALYMLNMARAELNRAMGRL
ncbi:MAG: TolC family protein [Armatimonadetes bacterium]|nr:TolC family protein [Armatimonadota bacterium]